MWIPGDEWASDLGGRQPGPSGLLEIHAAASSWLDVGGRVATERLTSLPARPSGDVARSGSGGRRRDHAWTWGGRRFASAPLPTKMLVTGLGRAWPAGDERPTAPIQPLERRHAAIRVTGRCYALLVSWRMCRILHPCRTQTPQGQSLTSRGGRELAQSRSNG